jgi:hypothetical protein
MVAMSVVQKGRWMVENLVAMRVSSMAYRLVASMVGL